MFWCVLVSQINESKLAGVYFCDYCLIITGVLTHYLYDRACQRAQILWGNNKGWH